MGSATPNIYKLEPPTCTDDQEGLYCEDCQDALEGTTWNTEPFASVRAEQIKKHHQGQQGSEEETAAASSSVKDTDLLNAWIKKFEMIYTGICKEEIANCKYNSLQSLVERLGVNVSIVFSKDNGSARVSDKSCWRTCSSLHVMEHQQTNSTSRRTYQLHDVKGSAGLCDQALPET